MMSDKLEIGQLRFRVLAGGVPPVRKSEFILLLKETKMRCYDKPPAGWAIKDIPGWTVLWLHHSPVQSHTRIFDMTSSTIVDWEVL